ncbi:MULTISPECIES: hypothetical protein [unclassified Streptomyces]|uniref:hypothetical protein n=1 Tax=unclassified Streptomyces TaxID=2593676 RepID=UPI003817BDBC
MNTGAKITAFAAALAATFGTAYGVGAAVGPSAAPAKAPAADGHPDHETETAPAPSAPAPNGPGTDAPGGLQVSDGGHTLVLEDPTPASAPGRTVLRFSIEDAAGKKVTAFATEHEKEMHFVVASRDLTVFRHLHPVKAPDGTWSAETDLPVAGPYRAFADFRPAAPGARALTLGADVSVPGEYAPKPLPAAAPTAPAGDGHQVRLSGTLDPGKPGELRFTVSEDGKPVTDLEPHLGAYGHLVALREGDLAYLHVHPNEGGPGPDVSFTATAPSAGAYRLFLDFRHGGEVRTAAFTVRAGASGAPVSADGEAEHGAGGHEHG